MIFNNKHYYKILELQNYAFEDDIKKSFRKLAIKNHPDRGGDCNRAQEISEAYQKINKILNWRKEGKAF